MRWLLVLSLVGCGSTGPADPPGTPTPAPTCTPAHDITPTPGTRFEDVAEGAAVAWPVPGVTWTASASRVGDAVRVEGVLTNTTDAEAIVDFLTGGVMGISTNPFQVDVDGVVPVATGPEIYPAPRRAILPPRGTITYVATRCPSFPAHVRWAFSPWGGPSLSGEATLP